MTLAVIVRRHEGDLKIAETKIDELKAARLYMKDRLDNQEERIAELTRDLTVMMEKKNDSEHHNRAKDARVDALRQAVGELKSDLIWGKFEGTPDELEQLFERVNQLL